MFCSIALLVRLFSMTFCVPCTSPKTLIFHGYCCSQTIPKLESVGEIDLFLVMRNVAYCTRKKVITISVSIDQPSCKTSFKINHQENRQHIYTKRKRLLNFLSKPVLEPNEAHDTHFTVYIKISVTTLERDTTQNRERNILTFLDLAKAFNSPLT